MKYPLHAPRARQHGVSLIELMVGVVIGLLATLVIAQVASLYEAQKRQTSSGSDAQLNGALALSTLQRDIQMGGYGLTSSGVARCLEISGQRAGTPYFWTMAPVLITQGSGSSGTVTGLADSIQVLMASNNNGFALPMRLRENQRRDDVSFVLEENTNVGNRLGDLLLVIPTTGGSPSPSPTAQVTPNWCSLAQINTDPTTTGDNLDHGVTSGPWNQSPSSTIFPGALTTDISYLAGSVLVNLGALTDRCYFVSGSNQRCGLATAASDELPYTLRLRSFQTSDASTTNQDLYPDVVNLQAVYGQDTSVTPDGVVDAWTDVSPTTSAGWSQVIAVRVAVLTRGTQYDEAEVTHALPNWRPNGATALNFTLPSCPSGESSCWRHYRYRVFESVIPLRNMLWQARQSP